jgi:hypothetical protein
MTPSEAEALKSKLSRPDFERMFKATLLRREKEAKRQRAADRARTGSVSPQGLRR